MQGIYPWCWLVQTKFAFNLMDDLRKINAESIQCANLGPQKPVLKKKNHKATLHFHEN